LTSLSEKALIIGVDSFTGYHLESWLRSVGCDVYGTVITADAAPPYFTCDITDKVSIRNVLDAVKPDYVINLSGISFVAHGNPADFYNINVIGAENVLQCLADSAHKPAKVIMVSSAIVYGNQGGVLHEDITPEPVNHYGISKLAMEFTARSFFDRLNIIIARPFNYTGEKQDIRFVIPKIVDHFRRKAETIELGNINTVREYNDVRMVTEVYGKLLTSDAKGETVNICSGRGYTISEVLETLKHLTGHEIKVNINPAFIRDNEIQSLTGSAEKLRLLIGDFKIYTPAEMLRSML
jgi:nucleoside-diphosphate-sugar epimerase